VALFGATLALGLVLLFAFEPDVQTVDAAELVRRSDDARAFLVADFFFVALYAVLSPIAQWRFGAAIGGGSPPPWVRAAALLLALAGLVDATENVLLFTATDSVAAGTVDAAHALEVPKVSLFVAGTAMSILVLVRAVREVRAPRAVS
jgi:hypothetical protein